MKGIIVILFAVTVHVIVGEVCPGGHESCAAGMTCCELPSGREGCCPYQNATCCPDKVHCCPNGFDCSTSRCTKREDGTNMELSKLIVENNEITVFDDNNELSPNASASSIVCPDTSQCEDGETCCPVGSGQYGCCPMAQAVCCSDLRTCCPSGYTCIGQGGCQLNDQIVHRVKIVPKSVVCPGGRYKCPDFNTCCRTLTGQYACCPLYHGVCCHDGVHCCPSGYTCDYSGQHCYQH